MPFFTVSGPSTKDVDLAFYHSDAREVVHTVSTRNDGGDLDLRILEVMLWLWW